MLKISNITPLISACPAPRLCLPATIKMIPATPITNEMNFLILNLSFFRNRCVMEAVIRGEEYLNTDKSCRPQERCKGGKNIYFYSAHAMRFQLQHGATFRKDTRYTVLRHVRSGTVQIPSTPRKRPMRERTPEKQRRSYYKYNIC